MKNGITFEPIFWRFLIWKVTPIWVGGMIGDLLYKFTHPYPSISSPAILIGIFAGAIIGAVIVYKEFNIVISENSISGPEAVMLLRNRMTFSTADVDKSFLHKQSLYEKVFLFHTIRSISGQKIMVVDFIYGKSATNEISKILEKDVY